MNAHEEFHHSLEAVEEAASEITRACQEAVAAAPADLSSRMLPDILDKVCRAWSVPLEEKGKLWRSLQTLDRQDDTPEVDDEHALENHKVAA